MQVANFIIGGTEKAGTTSIFSYLSEHPEVLTSKRKETDFFRTPGRTLEDYAEHFPDKPLRRIVMEASPGYLGEAEEVAPRIQAMLPDVKLLFILREPASRFLSSYNFHRARLNLPEDLSFRAYLDHCIAYANAVFAGRDPQPAVQRAGIGDWYLKVLQFGCYARLLRHYFEHFSRDRVAVMFYDDLRADPQAFMTRLSSFLDIDASCWQHTEFTPQNVTFSGRSKLLHRGALLVNDTLEPLLRAAPKLKSALTRLYKQVNLAEEGYEAMAQEDRDRIDAFYRPHNADLQALLGEALPPDWRMASPAGQRAVQ